MSDPSNARGARNDLLCSAPSAFFLWCVPGCAFALGFWAPPGLKMVLWTTSLAFMGCSVSDQRFALWPNSLPLHRTVPDSWRYCLARIWPWISAAWPVRLEMDWHRNNYWHDRAHLHSRTLSWPLSAK